MNYTKAFHCGCTIAVLNSGEGVITYCPKHKAAPDMCEALKEIVSDLTDIGDCRVTNHSFNLAQQALAKAEGGRQNENT